MLTRLESDIREILITEEEIKKKVEDLGAQITEDYKDREITIICVLKGAFMFLADLLRHIKVPVCLDFVAISSYGPYTQTSGVVKITKDLDESIEGKHVLIVEDIVDTGLTLDYLLKIIKARKPASVRVCALLDKPARREVEVEIHYKGFEIPDKFVVGYGLDYDQRYRNLPFVGVLKPDVYGGK